jgi:hypothetical protein
MSRMWLVQSNDRRLLRCVLPLSGLSQEQLIARGEGVYGSALFAHGGEVLTLKRPLRQSDEMGVHVSEFIDEDMRSTRYLANIDTEIAGMSRVADVQPFRHRGWAMGICGEQPPENLAEPADTQKLDREFVQRCTRGNSSSEALFHWVMVSMSKNGSLLQKAPDPKLLFDAVKQITMPSVGESFSKFAIALTNEHAGIVWAHGLDVSYRRINRVGRCPQCSHRTARDPRDPLLVSHPHLDAFAVVCGFDVPEKGWKKLPDGKALAVMAGQPLKIVKVPEKSE